MENINWNYPTTIWFGVDRIKEIDSVDKIFIIASKILVDKFKREISDIPSCNFIIEPTGKNTAPAIGLAALHIYKKDPKGVMVIYPADHLIKGNEKFVTTIKTAEKLVEQEAALVTIGIQPSFPSTSYGYIQFGDATNSVSQGYSHASHTRGVFSAGTAASDINAIDYITIATTGNAQDFGDLFAAGHNVGGTSNGHGGL